MAGNHNNGLPPEVGRGIEAIVVTLDSNAIITSINEYCTKVTGYAPDEVVGRNWFEVCIPGGDQEEIMEVFHEVWNGTDMYSGNENPIVTKDGTHLLIRWENFLLRDKDGRTQAVMAIGKDISNNV